MQPIAQLAVLASLFAVLGIAARYVISSVMVIGRRLRVGGFVAGFIILGLFTSAPEFLVALNAIADDTPSLAFGNLIGASIVLVTLITGLSVIIRGQVCILCMVRRRTLILFSLLLFLPVLLAADFRLSTTDGFVLIGAFAAFLLFVLSREHLYRIPAEVSNAVPMPRALGTFALGTGVLIIAAKFAADIGYSLAQATGISALAVGLLAFSIGTNLPELALIVTARRAAQRGFVLGDVLGSAAANTLIIGIVATARPFSVVDRDSYLAAGILLALALVLFVLFADSSRRLTGREGYILIAVYLAFLAAIFGLGVPAGLFGT